MEITLLLSIFLNKLVANENLKREKRELLNQAVNSGQIVIYHP